MLHFASEGGGCEFGTSIYPCNQLKVCKNWELTKNVRNTHISSKISSWKKIKSSRFWILQMQIMYLADHPFHPSWGTFPATGKKIDRSRHPAPPVTSNFGAEVGPGGPRLAPISKQSVIGMPIKKEWAHTPTMQCTLKHFPGWWQLSPTFARIWPLLGGLWPLLSAFVCCKPPFGCILTTFECSWCFFGLAVLWLLFASVGHFCPS